MALESGDIESRVTASAHRLSRWVKHKSLTQETAVKPKVSGDSV